MYSFVRPYMAITDIPGYAASGWKGDCGIQALLFVTLCRRRTFRPAGSRDSIPHR